MTEERQHKISNVLETYFSDASLLWDKVMLSKILADPKGSKADAIKFRFGKLIVF